MNREFLFSTDSEIWKINHEWCGLIYGPAAAILQIAHPRIAQGVADHSNFRKDSLGRLKRTLQATNRVAFGTVEEAEAVAGRMQQVHSRICGQTSPGMSGPAAYSAFEPDLLLWVLATLIEAAIRGYELVRSPLPPERLELFHREMREFGVYFGVRLEDGPQTWAEFQTYYADMLASEELGSHPLCAELAVFIARPRFLAVETLPETVRGRLGFRSTSGTRIQMRAFRTCFPPVFRALPRRLRMYSEARERLRRESQGSSFSPLRPTDVREKTKGDVQA